jgi:galactokinase
MMNINGTIQKPDRIRAASPGRIEFIGNHTDYNGGQVLGVALNLQVTAELTRRDDNALILSSRDGGGDYAGLIGSYEPCEGDRSWANYPLGVASVLASRGHHLTSGLEIRYESDLPAGAGLSSSAAIELSTLEALCAFEGIDLSGTDKVLLAQEAENTFVGVPCGMLDQAVSCYGQRDHLVRIDCATTTFSLVSLPAGLHFWIFNTNQKHSLVDSMYAQRHAECREALARLRERNPRIRHLVQAYPDDLYNIRGDAGVKKRAEHVIRENERVLTCVQALSEGDLQTVGDLLFASHESSRDLFENSTRELDTFVEILSGQRKAGVIGARLTGGGFGGAVMALCDSVFDREAAAGVIEAYRRRFPEAPAPDCIHVVTGEGTRRI